MAPTYINQEEYQKLNTFKSSLPFSWSTVFSSVYTTYNRDMLDLLLTRGFDLNAKDQDLPMLHALACDTNPKALDFISYLLEKGADIEIKNKSNRTPLGEAIANNNFEVFKYLVKQKADIFALVSPGTDALKSFLSTKSLHSVSSFETLAQSPHLNWHSLTEPNELGHNVFDINSALRTLLVLSMHQKNDFLNAFLSTIKSVDIIERIKERVRDVNPATDLSSLEKSLYKKQQEIEIKNEKEKLLGSVHSPFNHEGKNKALQKI